MTWRPPERRKAFNSYCKLNNDCNEKSQRDDEHSVSAGQEFSGNTDSQTACRNGLLRRASDAVGRAIASRLVDIVLAVIAWEAVRQGYIPEWVITLT